MIAPRRRVRRVSLMKFSSTNPIKGKNRKRLFEEAWMAQNLRKGLLNDVWRAPARCLSATPFGTKHVRIGSDLTRVRGAFAISIA